jgi:ubiquinone/menaquinone biosynthesis C-methylase UbiE
VNLLKDGVTPGGLWADLGSGHGAFTLALADLLGDTGTIISVDKDSGALHDQERSMRARFPAIRVEYRTADFSGPLDLPPLDGIVMANSLHYFKRKDAIVAHVRGMLKPGGRLIVVEYNVDRGNWAVPHPFTYPQWAEIAARAGFAKTRLLGTVPSSFLHEFYSALSTNA